MAQNERCVEMVQEMEEKGKEERATGEHQSGCEMAQGTEEDKGRSE